MLVSGRYLYVLFCSQQAIEKRVKARLVEQTGEFPPRTHDLVKLCQSAKIIPTDDQDRFLRLLTKYYIGTRYPEEVTALVEETTRELAAQYLGRTKEFLRWLETLQR